MNLTTELASYLLSTVGALIPIVNPFSTAAIVVSMSATHTDAERKVQVRRACIYVFFILTSFLVAGGVIMSFFGISIPGLRIAGGLVVAFVGFRMLFPSQSRPSADGEPQLKQDMSFTPLAMPSLAGPGSIAVVIGMSSTAQASTNVILRHVMITIGIALTAVFCYYVLRGATKLARFLGPTGLTAMVGTMGFLLVCIGVQFIINGVTHLVAGLNT